jgi:hypothetical protein
MNPTKSQRHNRRKRADRKKRREQYVLDRMKEPQFPLAKSIADELGDIEPGTPITMREFQRCLFRIADIRAGRVKRPNTKARTNEVSGVAA